MTNPKHTSSDLVREMRDLADAFGDDVQRRYSQDLLRDGADRIEALRLAVVHYDAALKSSWPHGAKGDAWEHWNEARITLHEAGETFTHPDNV